MLVDRVLRAVRDAQPLDAAQLKRFVDGVTDGSIPDYQASAFLMAVFCRGLSSADASLLTLAMRDSGQVIDLSHIEGRKVDKHSTGGVGDKISIPLAPIVAACGAYVPMISGRGLGHSGGTLDKLESVPGFNVQLSVEQFRAQVAELGTSMIGQTADIAPADRILYALRDVTATVESIPLITASILSKKLAEGIDALVLDVKVGSGAFMKTESQARELARSLVSVGKSAGVEIRAVLSSMDQPLGRCVGNALEVRESVEILQGRGPDDSTELTVVLAGQMLQLARRVESTTEGEQHARAVIADGSAYQRFCAMVEAQGGDVSVLDRDWAGAPVVREVVAPNDGVVHAIDAFAIGMAAVALGAGRSRAEDGIDARVGFELNKKVGDSVQTGEVLALVHAADDAHALAASDTVLRSYRFEDVECPSPPLVIGVIDPTSDIDESV